MVHVWFRTLRTTQLASREIQLMLADIDRLCIATSWFWVCVFSRGRRVHASVRRRGPAHVGHVWTATNAAAAVVAVGRWLERLRRAVASRVRGHGWSAVMTGTVAGEGG